MRYLLLATLGTALFFGAYWLLMRRETRFGMVRAYLAGTLLLALALPLVQLKVALPGHYSAPQEADLALTEWHVNPDGTLVTARASEAGTLQVSIQQDAQNMPRIMVQRTPASPKMPWWQRVLPWVYLSGCGVSALVLAVTALRLRRRLHKLPYETIGEVDFLGIVLPVRLSVLDDDTPAFSFGRHIVVGCKGFSDAEVQQLVGHELVHVREGHTADLLLCRLARVVLWFNPFVWLYEREMKRVHEYIADREMLQTEQGAQYAELFYHQVSGHLYSPLGNSFDYRMVGKRIAMMSRRPSRRGWLKPLVLVPLTTLVLVAGCTPKGTLSGNYGVERMTLMSDNPDEPDLLCSEFLGLENRIFCFHRDGHIQLLTRDSNGCQQRLTYTMDTTGLHIYDSAGVPWMDMSLETLHCNGDSIVLRFVDADPVGGLDKMLRGLPTYRYRVDTVEVSTPATGPNGEHIELNSHTSTDTVFAHVSVPCPINNSNHWYRGNRLLGASMSNLATCVRRSSDQKGRIVIESHTEWEFHGNAIDPDAHLNYDTASCYNPRMEGDRFILEVVLKKQ